jgi:catechol 2,3-dioxygenase-like lactoylglutathione lyase family enzyme
MHTATATKLLRVAPYFPVGDVERTTRYYESILGFKRDYMAGTPPMFAIVSRDDQPLMLRLVADPKAIVPMQRQGGTWDAFFWVNDARGLHDELRGKGATVLYQPLIQPYGVDEFAIRDQDGHVLGFGQKLES